MGIFSSEYSKLRVFEYSAWSQMYTFFWKRLHFQKKQLPQMYIFISSWIAGLDDDIQWSELFPLSVHLTEVTEIDMGKMMVSKVDLDEKYI